ncbi:MAG: phosphotransferase [Anaerolineaceae bacterium]|nr:phosphotransferase [Anaerolineaceae bacterium]
MKSIFPVKSSLLLSQTISTEVLPQFGLGANSKCEYFTGGFSHTYRVTSEKGVVYFLKSYRTNWRTKADIQYEMDVLNHLKKKNFPAIQPVKTITGEYYYPVNAPEGIRYLVLLTLAPGTLASYEQKPEEVATQYGQAVAQMHNALDDFHSIHQRFPLDLDFFTVEPLKTIEPFLKNRPDDWHFIQQFANTLRQRIIDMPGFELELGFCHGDLQGYHANVSPDGTFTFFDFDCGGYGYRAYDLAVFLWCCRLENAISERWEPFLKAYKSQRVLTPLDERAIPLFVCARYLWHIGVHTRNTPDWGIEMINDEYLQDHLGKMRKAEEDYLLQ